MRSAQNAVMLAGVTLVALSLLLVFLDMDAITGKQYGPAAGGGGVNTGGGNSVGIQYWCIDTDNGDFTKTPAFAVQVKGYHDPVKLLTNAINFTNVQLDFIHGYQGGGHTAVSGSFNYRMPGSTKVYKAEDFKILVDSFGDGYFPAPASRPASRPVGAVSSGSTGVVVNPISISGGSSIVIPIESSISSEPGENGRPITVDPSSNNSISAGSIANDQDPEMVFRVFHFERLCETVTPIKKGSPNIMSGKIITKKREVKGVDSRLVTWPFINGIYHVIPFASNGTDTLTIANNPPAAIQNQTVVRSIFANMYPAYEK